MRLDRRWLLLLPLIAVACAQVREITGGEKDEAPPVLTAAYPPNYSTGFKSNTITLEFDERIQLDRVRDRLLVSPPLDEPPTVRISGAKSVTLELNAPLRPNTTYSFMIGEAIKDLTEGNAVKGLVYVVSTGDFLDSLEVQGGVVNAFSGTPEKDLLVMLHDVLDTGNLRTSRPTYASRSLEDGSFHMRHIRPGTYRLFALRDKNANYRYDLPNEEIAFSSGIVELPAPTLVGDTVPLHYSLRLFQESSAIQQVREAKVLPDGALRIVLARPEEQLGLRDVARTGGALQWAQEWNITRDTILFWPSDTTELRGGLYELRTDHVLDTVRYRPVQRMPFFTALQARTWDGASQSEVIIRSSRPLVRLDQEQFQLQLDSIVLPFTLSLDSIDRRTIHLASAIPEGASAQLTVLPKAVTDIYGGHNDTLRTGLGRAAEQSTGTLRIKIRSDTGNTAPLILQLLSNQDRLVRETLLLGDERNVIWERLQPGNHVLRLIMDQNGNGRWDTGDLDVGLQPEPVWRNAEEVNVRAAWDLGVDWKIP